MENKNLPKHNVIFASNIFPGSKFETNSLLLAESIRFFGGSFAKKPIWFSMPEEGYSLSEKVKARLEELNIRLIPFSTQPRSNDIFFMEQLAGLAMIEELSEKEAEYLVWMDANTLLLNEPQEVILSRGKVFGYRPVHHLLIGSKYDQPLDPFWEQIYRCCQVPPERVFPMQPVVEETQMRPYFNAGFMVVRPLRNLIRQWHASFSELSQSSIFNPFLQHDERYSIYLHQAVLAGTVLRLFNMEETQELPDTYNYPMHLYEIDHTSHRPLELGDLTTVRHEGFYFDPDWRKKMPASEEMKQWLAEKLSTSV